MRRVLDPFRFVLICRCWIDQPASTSNHRLPAGGEPAASGAAGRRTYGTFAEIGDFASSTLLADGRVLIVGYYSAVAGLYGPDTGSFSHTGKVALTSVSNAVLLTDGKVLFTGGDD